ncbi:MAG: ABC transporter permease [Lachnospiraceae bacterium]|nr:ABC transporter permease [Lachnospiraceae bacterium]
MMINPVLRREAKTTLRTFKIFLAVSLYVIFLAGIAGIYLWGETRWSYMSGFDPQSMNGLYTLLGAVHIGFILIITPALTSGSISGERERQTLDLLLVTKMSPLSIVLGKLVSSLGLSVLLTFAAAPVFAIVLYFGSFSALGVLKLVLYCLVSSCLIGSIAIYLSSVFKRTVTASVMVYIIIGALCVGTLIAYFVYMTIYVNITSEPSGSLGSLLILCLNPILGFLSIIGKETGMDIVGQIFSMFRRAEVYPWYVGDFYIVNIIASLALAALFVVLTVKRLKSR